MVKPSTVYCIVLYWSPDGQTVTVTTSVYCIVLYWSSDDQTMAVVTIVRFIVLYWSSDGQTMVWGSTEGDGMSINMNTCGRTSPSWVRVLDMQNPSMSISIFRYPDDRDI